MVQPNRVQIEERRVQFIPKYCPAASSNRQERVKKKKRYSPSVGNSSDVALGNPGVPMSLQPGLECRITLCTTDYLFFRNWRQGHMPDYEWFDLSLRVQGDENSRLAVCPFIHDIWTCYFEHGRGDPRLINIIGRKSRGEMHDVTGKRMICSCRI